MKFKDLKHSCRPVHVYNIVKSYMRNWMRATSKHYQYSKWHGNIIEVPISKSNELTLVVFVTTGIPWADIGCFCAKNWYRPSWHWLFLHMKLVSTELTLVVFTQKLTSTELTLVVFAQKLISTELTLVVFAQKLVSTELTWVVFVKPSKLRERILILAASLAHNEYYHMKKSY